MKNILWIAVFSVALACVAVAMAVVDLVVDADLASLILGTGLASVTFGLAGLADKFSTSRRDN